MSTLTVQNLPPVQHNGFRVITTELLANVYETEINNIQQNFKRNKKRFIEGKHYFKIVGDALNNLRLTMSQLQISAKVRSLILWTERGAARHAKMLDTDNAWDVFEALEDFYFAKKEDVFHKTTTDDRAPLRNAVDCLMTKKRLSFPKAYGYVHAKYGVNSIDEVPLDLLPEAVDYIYKVALEGEYLPNENKPVTGGAFLTDEELLNLCYVWNDSTTMIRNMLDIEPLLQVAEHKLAGSFYEKPRDAMRKTNALRRTIERATQHIQIKRNEMSAWNILHRIRIPDMPW